MLCHKTPHPWLIIIIVNTYRHTTATSQCGTEDEVQILSLKVERWGVVGFDDSRGDWHKLGVKAIYWLLMVILDESK